MRFTPNSAIDASVTDRRDHYDVLGVRRGASPRALKDAYRRRMRELHPDSAARQGRPIDHAEIAAVSAAWSVLSDPKRRAAYDTNATSAPSDAERVVVRPPDFAPARFPWRFVLSLIAIGTAAILLVAAFTGPGEPTKPDNLLQSGSCVVIGVDGTSVSEVTCDGPHDAVVRSLVAFDAACPSDTDAFLDRQGMGRACVVDAVRAAGESGG